MEKCPVCKKEKKGRHYCSACRTVFVCPQQNCETVIFNRKVRACPKCGLLFDDYIDHHKMYRQCPKCGRKQGLSDPQCRYCRYWFNCPTCGHKVPSTSMLTCPRCATSLR